MTKLNRTAHHPGAFGYDCSVTNHGYTVVMASDDSRLMATTPMVGFATICHGGKLRIKPFAFDVFVSPLEESSTYPQIAQVIADRCGFEHFSVLDCGVLPKGWHYSFGFEGLGFLLNLHSESGHVASVRSVVGGFLARHNLRRCEKRLKTTHGAIAWAEQQERWYRCESPAKGVA